MQAFLVETQPRSYNASKKTAYKKRLRDAYARAYSGTKTTAENLYGLVYHFWSRSVGLDADNLSKPVWDALGGIAYADDSQIRLRVAGSFEVLPGEFQTLDLTRIPDAVAGDLLDRLGEADHLLYVEIGPFSPALVRFGL